MKTASENKVQNNLPQHALKKPKLVALIIPFRVTNFPQGLLGILGLRSATLTSNPCREFVKKKKGLGFAVFGKKNKEGGGTITGAALK